MAVNDPIVIRGYLPFDYYLNHNVYGPKRPKVTELPYPNKIDLSATDTRYYAIVSKSRRTRLSDLLTWMSNHSYIRVNIHLHSHINIMHPSPCDPLRFTGKVVVEAYDAPSRPYSMVVFRPARKRDERAECLMVPRGQTINGALCLPPHTAITCAPGSDLRSIWQWLALHRGRFADVSQEPAVRNTIVLVEDHWNRRMSTDGSELAIDAQNSVSALTLRLDSPRPSQTDIYGGGGSGGSSSSSSSSGGWASEGNSGANIYYDSRGRRVHRDDDGEIRARLAVPSAPRRRLSISSIDSMLPPYEPPLEDRQVEGNNNDRSTLPPDYRSLLGATTAVGEDISPSSRQRRMEDSQGLQPSTLPSYWQVASLTEYGRSWVTSLLAYQQQQ